MRILVTGGLGYTGSHIIVDLIKQGHTVYSIDNVSRSIIDAISTIRKLTGTLIKNYCQDLATADILNCDIDLAELQNVDCIIHCAGYKSVNESIEKPDLYYHNNIDSTLNVIKIMKRCNIKNLIFSSSCTVYTPHHGVVTEESKIGNCTNPYGWSKYMQEQMLRDLAKANPDYSICSLRYFNPIGSFTYLADKSKTNLLPNIVDAMNGKIEKLKVYGHDYITRDGTCVRDYIHVEDLAAAHVKMIDYIKEHKGYEVFNVGTGHGFTVLDVITKFEEVNDVKINWEYADRRPGDQAIAYSNSQKLRHAINWRPKYNLADMVNLQL